MNAMTSSAESRTDPSAGKSGASPGGVGTMGSVDDSAVGNQEYREKIAQRAYELAMQRGFAPGGELDDWLQAEREIEAGPVRNTPPDNPLGRAV